MWQQMCLIFPEQSLLLQVTGLAMCKHNKNDMLLRKMSTHWRHDNADQLFHDYLRIPQEALKVADLFTIDHAFVCVLTSLQYLHLRLHDVAIPVCVVYADCPAPLHVSCIPGFTVHAQACIVTVHRQSVLFPL